MTTYVFECKLPFTYISQWHSPILGKITSDFEEISTTLLCRYLFMTYQIHCYPLRNSRYFYVATTSYVSSAIGGLKRETPEEQEDKLRKAIQKDLGLQVIFDCDPPRFESNIPRQTVDHRSFSTAKMTEPAGEESEEHIGIFSFSIQQAVLFLFYHYCLLHNKFQVVAPIPSWIFINQSHDSTGVISLSSGSFMDSPCSPSSLLTSAMLDNYYGLQFIAKINGRSNANSDSHCRSRMSSYEGLVMYSFERCVLTTTFEGLIYFQVNYFRSKSLEQKDIKITGGLGIKEIASRYLPSNYTYLEAVLPVQVTKDLRHPNKFIQEKKEKQNVRKKDKPKIVSKDSEEDEWDLFSDLIPDALSNKPIMPISDMSSGSVEQDENEELLISDDEISFTKSLTIQDSHQHPRSSSHEQLAIIHQERAILLSTAQDVLVKEHFTLPIPVSSDDSVPVPVAMKEEIRCKLISISDRKRRTAGYRQYLPDSVRKFIRYWKCGYGVDPMNCTSKTNEVSNEEEIALTRVNDGSYEIVVPTSCLVSVLAEYSTIPTGIYDEAIEEMKKALDSIQCISIIGEPITSFDMQERHKQHVLSAQKEKSLDIDMGTRSIFVKATALRVNTTSSSGSGEVSSSKGKGQNKGKNKKKVQYLLDEEKEDKVHHENHHNTAMEVSDTEIDIFTNHSAKKVSISAKSNPDIISTKRLSQTQHPAKGSSMATMRGTTLPSLPAIVTDMIKEIQEDPEKAVVAEKPVAKKQRRSSTK